MLENLDYICKRFHDEFKKKFKNDCKTHKNKINLVYTNV